MGFFLSDTTGVNTDYGFRSFAASDNADLPLIVSQPRSQVVNLSSSATFQVTATGTGPFSYQWYFNGTNIIDWATDSQCTLTNVQDVDAGAFRVAISNWAGSVLSDIAQLAVNHMPVPASPTLERYWGSGFKIRETLLLGTDPDGDPVSLISVGPLSAQGGTVSDNQGWVSYTPPAGLTNDDSFGYTVGDGRGGFASGTATVVMITNTGPLLSLGWDASTNGVIRLAGSGIADRSYTIQVTGDPGSGNWQPVGSVMSDDFGLFVYEEPLGATNRFYRVVSP
jgi:hypothetical protein